MYGLILFIKADGCDIERFLSLERTIQEPFLSAQSFLQTYKSLNKSRFCPVYTIFHLCRFFSIFQRFVAVPAIFIHGIISSFAMFLDEEMKGLDFMYNFN